MPYDFWDRWVNSKPSKGTLANSGYTYTFTGNVHKVREEHLRLIPRRSGIYIIIGRHSIYCGRGKNLNQRVLQSIRKRGFGEWVIFLNSDEISIQDADDLQLFWVKLEIECISALSTIITYNNLPIELINQQHCYPLPCMAWEDPEKSPYMLPITIAQTALSSFTIPTPAPHKTSPFEYAYRLWPLMEPEFEHIIRQERTIWAPRVVKTLSEIYLEPADYDPRYL